MTGQVIDAISKKQLDPYEAADRMVVWMQDNQYALGTIFKYRSYLPKLYRFCKIPFDQEAYDENVRLVRKLTETRSKTPTPEQTKQLLENPDQGPVSWWLLPSPRMLESTKLFS